MDSEVVDSMPSFHKPPQ